MMNVLGALNMTSEVLWSYRNLYEKNMQKLMEVVVVSVAKHHSYLCWITVNFVVVFLSVSSS